MAFQIKGDGTWAAEYVGPFSGLNTQAPETNIPDTATPQMLNIMLRNAELRSRPALLKKISGPGGSNPQIRGLELFLDINGVYHIVLWTEGELWQYNPSLLPAVPWSGLNAENISDILSYQVFANTVYYTGVSQFYGTVNPFMSFWDGITSTATQSQTFSDASTSQSVAGISLTDSPTVGGSLPGGPTMVGPLAIGGQYIGELNNQIILFNVSVLDQGTNTIYNFPNMVWWSANGLPLQWDPTQNTSAGFNPFLDVPDQITGRAMLGVAGYIFRTNGITQMTPTGSAAAPYEFDHMWASDHGIGNVFPWSIAQYGPNCLFVAQDNIYSISVTNALPIGGTARDAIYADLANAIGHPVGAIIPIFQNGYVYLTYQLIIQLSVGANPVTKFWVYSMEDKNWASWETSNPNAFELGTPNVV